MDRKLYEELGKEIEICESIIRHYEHMKSERQARHERRIHDKIRELCKRLQGYERDRRRADRSIEEQRRCIESLEKRQAQVKNSAKVQKLKHITVTIATIEAELPEAARDLLRQESRPDQ